jgi:hypothetical protein
MIARTLALAGLLAAVALTPLPAATEQLSVDEIKPGMVGVGRTVFEGSRLDEFKAHILGVLRNVTGPRRNLILARLEGGPLAETGVIAGMSGSPVYIDGKLIGAVSYSLGAFSKSPIAGITPIAEMIEAASFQTPRQMARSNARLEMPLTAEAAARAVRQAFTWSRPFAERPGEIQASTGETRIDPSIGTLLRPVGTPLMMGGFTPEMADLVSVAFRDSGFVPVIGGGAGGSDTPMPSGPLEPGDALGISLISGDLSLGATGTVTHVDGDKVYAFGHPFYNLGPTEFPMTRAYVHTLLPSLFTSMKIATTGDVIGTLKQDRATTVAGTLGDGPPLIPIRVELDSERGLRKTFAFNVVNDQLFTPLLAYVSILNTLGQYEREFGVATFSVKGKAVVKGHGTVGFENIFAGDAPSIGAAAYVAAPITFLLSNDYEPVQIEGLDLTITST